MGYMCWRNIKPSSGQTCCARVCVRAHALVLLRVEGGIKLQ